MPTFRVSVDGVRTREEHDAVNAAVTATLLRHLAALDVAPGDVQRVVLGCTCSGNAGSGDSGRVAGTDPAKPFVPLRVEHRTVPLADDQLGRFRFDLAGVDLPEEQRAAVERDLQLAVRPRTGVVEVGPGPAADDG